jgi:hypothetical protein
VIQSAPEGAWAATTPKRKGRVVVMGINWVYCMYN